LRDAPVGGYAGDPTCDHGAKPGTLLRQTWSWGSFNYVLLAVRRAITNEIWSEIRTAYASGIGLREIARNMGIPEGTVLARAKREGWTREIQNAKALVKREDSALAVTPVEAVAMSMQQRGERHLERMAGVSERGVDHIETLDGPEILNSVDQIEKLDKVARRTFRLDDNPLPAGFSLNVLNIDSLDITQGKLRE
jgi:hypothetical protein